MLHKHHIEILKRRGKSVWEAYAISKLYEQAAVERDSISKESITVFLDDPISTELANEH